MYKRTKIAGMLIELCYTAAGAFSIYVFAGLLADMVQTPPLSQYDGCGETIGGIIVKSGQVMGVLFIFSIFGCIWAPSLVASVILIKRGDMDAKGYKNSRGKTIVFIVVQGIAAFCLADFASIGVLSLIRGDDHPLFSTFFAVPSVIIATGVALIILDLIKNSKDLKRIG
ncbi:MAG: hypothetical protein LBP62_01735 [Clostridiales bacterium]|jgi:hypothetical protein|nr:hypothetical protein [Clostridiales bacterium]